MKKMLVIGMLAISWTALSEQPASAWINSRFSSSLNWDWQSGGNSFGWGLWRNGQPPGPEALQSGPYLPHFSAPAPYPYVTMPPGAAATPMVDPSYASPSNYAPPFQFATYPRPMYYYYPAPNYYGR